jgi:hypothetical protein
MSDRRTSLFLGSLAVVACGAAMLGSCSNESLGGSGSGGKTGTGGHFGGGVGGSNGTGASFGGTTGTGASTLGFGGTTGGGGDGGDGGSLGSGGAAPGGIGGGGSGGDGIGAGGSGGDCLVIADEPPIFTIFDAQTGLAICDPTFDVVAVSAGGIIPDASGNPVSCKELAVFGCPTDNGDSSCPFALEAIGDMPPTSQYTVQISAPGYSSSTAYEVVAGREGCTGDSAASQMTIILYPGSAPPDAGSTIDARGPSN